MSRAALHEAMELARQRLFEPLERVRRRARLYLALGGALRVVVWLVVLSAAQLLLDRWLRFSIDQRAVLNVILTLVWAWVIVRWLVRPLRAPLRDGTLATAVDRLWPQQHDRIASAVELARDAGSAEFNSPTLVAQVIREACAASDRISFVDVLDHARARRWALQLGSLLATVAIAWVVMWTPLSTWFQRNWLLREIPWPQATTIRPVGFDAHGQRAFPRGDELEILADNAGRVPKRVTLAWATLDGRSGRQTMARLGQSRWQASLGVLTESLSFRIRGGDEHTPAYHVIAVDRPRVEKMTTRVSPPAYTGLQPVELSQQVVLEVLRGSTVEIEARLNKAVEQAAIVDADGQAVGVATLEAPRRLRWRWDAPQSGAYKFVLTDRYGFENRRPVRLRLKVRPDAPPTIELIAAGVKGIITPNAQISLRITAGDQYGLSQVAAFAQRNDDPPIRLDLDGFEPGAGKFETQIVLNAATLDLTPEQRLTVWAECADNDPAGPNITRTEPLALRVLSVTDFLAEMAQREQELRQEFERLLSAQRGLSDALTRLEAKLPEEGPPSTAEAQQLASLARRQGGHAQRTLAIAERFSEILEQMRVCRVGRGADQRRIGDRIVNPLEALGRGAMPAASAAVAVLREAVTPVRLRDAARQQAEVKRAMRTVLAQMLEWEGYREAVALLSDIIEQQQAVREQTEQALNNQLEDILGLDIPFEAAPGDTPKP